MDRAYVICYYGGGAVNLGPDDVSFAVGHMDDLADDERAWKKHKYPNNG